MMLEIISAALRAGRRTRTDCQQCSTCAHRVDAILVGPAAFHAQIRRACVFGSRASPVRAVVCSSP